MEAQEAPRGSIVLRVHPALAAVAPNDTLVDRIGALLLSVSSSDHRLIRAVDRLADEIRNLAVESEPEFQVDRLLIDELEHDAHSSEYPAVFSLAQFWVARSPRLGAEALARRFRLLDPAIQNAWPVPRLIESTVDPSNDPDHAKQSYLKPARTGIDALYAWAASGCDGSGLRLADIESGWAPHDDLPVNNVKVSTTGGNLEHGAAVLGIICALDNDILIVGIAPKIDPPWTYGTKSGTLVAKILGDIALEAKAGTGLSKGDVVLLEVQTANREPVEVNDDVRAAIRACAAQDLIVIESAGNGGLDLDALLPDGGVGDSDSGAIIVAASDATKDHARWIDKESSCFGARCDCFAPGDGVMTVDGFSAAKLDKYFGGTSAASAIVAGAALMTQHMAEKALGHRLSPKSMRDLLSDPTLGTTHKATEPIGVMPDLRKIWDVGFAAIPTLHIRDNLGDDGSVPTVGNLTSSPDIFAVPAGGVSLWMDSEVPPAGVADDTVPHEVYFRVANLSGGAPAGVTGTVFWSPPATLVLPSMWTLIGSAPIPGALAAADGLVTSPPIPWPADQLPEPGHYCFVGTVTHAEDPAPAVPDFMAEPDPGAAYRDFIRYSRHYAWRNFNVVAVAAGEEEQAVAVYLTALPGRAREYSLYVEVENPVPDARIAFELPPEVPWASHGSEEGLARSREGERRMVAVRAIGEPVGTVLLDPAEPPPVAKLLVTWPLGSLESGRPLEIGVCQYLDGRELGRVTWSFAPVAPTAAR